MDKKNLLTKIKEIALDVKNFGKEPETPAIKLAQETMDSGTVFEAESFEAGQAVFIVNEDERIPVPVGDYEWEGKLLIVTEEGMIAEIKEAVTEDPEAEVEAGVEYVTVEQFNEAIDEIKSMFSTQKEEADLELKKVEDEKVKLQKEIDETPDAVATKHQPKEKVILNKEPASTSRGRIMQFVNNNKN